MKDYQKLIDNLRQMAQMSAALNTLMFMGKNEADSINSLPQLYSDAADAIEELWYGNRELNALIMETSTCNDDSCEITY